ncbi:LicD family-domain-containing protein [Xylariaceae sp. AK1471]|nr:LicD family-domain-containing protein [Xylariaceae sp. AK1471]
MRFLRPLLVFALAVPAIARAAAISPERKGVAARGNGNDKKTASPPHEQTKYFHEPGWDAESGHYDARYFQGKVPYEEHRPALQHLIRSYLTTFRDLGVETWLAHGSLLGWWWNGRIMPWDYDLDVQVSTATLQFLGGRYNRSTHEYYYNDVDNPPNTDTDTDTSILSGSGTGSRSGATITKMKKEKKKKKTYLLDVNPHHSDLTKGNGANIIDARWIDTSNGMFIDITGLREREVERSPGVWSCKNNHRYRTAELWPLRRTQFENVEAWIPYAFDKVLTDEYGPKSLLTTEWAGHIWMPELKEWIKAPELPKKEKEHQFPGDRGKENVIVYKEVVVEV